MRISDEMTDKLQQAFSPTQLRITDESESHRGHSGYKEGGESHFHIQITADAFASMSRIQRHRAVHNALGQDIIDRIHALALQINS